MKKRTLKLVRNVLISVGVLSVLFVGGGVAYTWYVGQQPVVTQQPAAPVTKAFSEPVITHAKPAPNAPVGAAMDSLTSPVAPGANVTAEVRTTPGAQCTITVVYNNVASKDSGLIPRIADDFGTVSWTWTVESSVPVGKWPVTVTCTYNKKSAVVQGELEVATS